MQNKISKMSVLNIINMYIEMFFAQNGQIFVFFVRYISNSDIFMIF